VWQVELPRLAGAAVVKQLVDGPEAGQRFAREVTALRLAAAAEPPVAPRLLGFDPDQRVLVLEYLEDRAPGDDWLVGYAGALARLHAAGVSGAAGAAGGSGVAGGLPGWRGPSDEDIGAFLGLAGVLGVSVRPGVRGELEGLVGRLAQAALVPGRVPGQAAGRPSGQAVGRAAGRALLHGDPCPDNFLHTAGGVRFVDFENAAWGDGLVELAYLRIGFPTCWCALAPERPLLAAAEAAYRATWRDVTGTDVAGDVTDACAGWLLRGDGLVERALRGPDDHLGRLLDEDWTWGVATARQRLLHRLLVVGELAGPDGPLAKTGRLAGDMAASVLRRWPGLGPLPARWQWWEGLAGG
jgi:tRNA A-37 threonylcarbamoyl transferase component Bud32